MTKQPEPARAGDHDPKEAEYTGRFNVPRGESTFPRKPRRFPPDDPGPSWDDAVRIIEEGR